MTWSAEQAWWAAGVVAALVTMLVTYALRLRRRLAEAECKLHNLTENLENTVTEVRRLSGLDALTGVPNRRFFDEMLDKEWARGARARQPLAVIMVDIDRFKLHNDTYGHQAGDDCLKQVAAILRNAVRRPADLLARYGGEEFGIILPGVDLSGATAVAERMRGEVASIKLSHVNNVTGYDVTISLGVAVIVPDARSSALELVAAADEALYRAKAVGRNQVIAADMREAVSETIEL